MLLSSDRPQPLGGKVVVMLTLQELKKMTEKPEENQKPPTARFLMEQETLLVSRKSGKVYGFLSTETVMRFIV